MTPLADNTIKGNLATMLFLITETEGTDRQGTPYNELFGYGNFNSFATHPNIRVPFYNPKRPGTKGVPNDYSTAAGRYQINFPTYQALGMKDFTPESQDRAALQLLNRNNAVDYVAAGEWKEAIKRASSTWASLPGSNSKQPQVSLNKALAFINNNKGTITTIVPATMLVLGITFLIYKFG